MTNLMRKSVFWGGAAVALTSFAAALFVVADPSMGIGGGMARAAQPVAAPKKHHPVEIQGPLLGGGHLNTRKWRGKVVIVDFWGTWCPWCRKQAPYIAHLYTKYRRHGLRVVGVPVFSTVAELKKYGKQHPNESWPQIFGKKIPNTALAQAFGITGFPTEFIIDRQGILRHVLIGYSPRTLAKDVQKLLAKHAKAHG